jgi:hypothetical protein
MKNILILTALVAVSPFNSRVLAQQYGGQPIRRRRVAQTVGWHVDATV